MKIRLTAALLLQFLLVACSSGDDDGDEAPEQIDQADLAIMVVPPAEFGEEYADTPVDPDSGFADSDEAADDSLDPADTGQDLEEMGYQTGYGLSVFDYTLAPLDEGGAYGAGTGVELLGQRRLGCRLP